MFLTVAVAIVTLLPVSWAGDPCPPKDELGTCSCTYEEFESGTELLAVTDQPSNSTTTSAPSHKERLSNYPRTTVRCNASSSLLYLEEKVSLEFHRKTIDRLVLSRVPPVPDHTLSNLPSSWLKNIRVKMIQIQDTMLSADFFWRGEPFDGQEKSLLWILVTHCYLNGALTFDSPHTPNTEGLNQLEYLEGLDLSYNHLTAVYNTAFRHPPLNLTTLILSHNSLTTLDSTAFHYVDKLKYIDLSNNHLESVTRSTFPENLEYINLGWNFLRELPTDFFNSMPSLKTVKLEHNFLYTMPDEPWSIVWKQLTFVNVTGNFIHCDCNLLWLLPMVPEGNSNRISSTISGSCVQDNLPKTEAMQHQLSTLKLSQLVCIIP